MLCRVFIFILFTFAPAVNSNISRLCRVGCLKGSDCVNNKNICNGTTDCNDGSDENDCPIYDTIRPGNKRVHTRAVKSPCVLPPYPAHGSYEVLNVPQVELKGPGQTLDSFVLRVSCELGYGMIETVSSSNTLDIYCVNGVINTMPQCVRFCNLDPDPSIRYICPGNKLCPRYVAPNTRVTPVCNTPIYTSSELLLYMQCENGSWNHIVRCKPDCGRITPEGDALLIDGTAAKRGELPWHVGIYRKMTPYLQICGGSLVSSNVVISAAHCFWSDVHKQLPASNFSVASGKLYRPWDDYRDNDAQTSDVLRITIPELFQGVGANFQEDIAILTLYTPFVFKTYIRPVCLNFDHGFDNWHLQHNNLGKVAGWGLTGANGISSEYLKVADMPFIDARTCISTLPPAFRSLVTGDKFCAGYTNGTSLCKGDSGGGICFPETEQGVDRYYLRGIVSTAPTTTNKLCNDRSYTTFTRITKHEDLIKNALAAAKAVEDGNRYQNIITTAQTTTTTTTMSPEVPLGLPTPTPTRYSGGSIFLEKLPDPPECGVISQDFSNIEAGRPANVKLGDLPWIALLGYKGGRNNSDTRWLCGGSLISQYHVLTAAFCTNNRRSDLYLVRFEELYWTSEDEATPLDVLIEHVFEHEDYSAASLANDIAVLRLQEAVKYTTINPKADPSAAELNNQLMYLYNYTSSAYRSPLLDIGLSNIGASIRPICLPKATLRERNFELDISYIAGWSRNEFNVPISTNLQVQKMKVVENSFCIVNKMHVIDKRVLCAFAISEINGSCLGDYGGPLMQPIPLYETKTSYFYQIGVFSNDRRCREGSGSLYTRITHFIPWIEKQVVGDYESDTLLWS